MANLVTADEGEPLMFYGSDEPGQNPKGSVSVVKINSKKPGKSKVKTLYFDKSDSYYADRGVRLYGVESTKGGQNVALRDIEPEYVGIVDNKTALVALQENNALAEVNIKKGKIKGVFGLGYIDWPGFPVATSDEDGGYKPSLKNNLFGARMPDGIDTFKAQVNGKKQLLFISPNEGDGRVRPDEVNFEASIDGIFSFGTNSTGSEIDTFTDPLNLSDTLYVYDQPGQGNLADFEAEEGDEFFITTKYEVGDDDEFWSDEIRRQAC